MGLAINVDESGISVKDYREVRNNVAAKFKSIFGDSIDTSPSSPDGQLIDLFVYSYHDAALAIESAIVNLDVSSSSGTFLDNIGTIMGVPRNGDDDDVYRARLETATTTGMATFDNMLTYLRANIASGVNMVENCEPGTDSNGIPGHSVAVYVPEGFYAEDDQGNDITGDFIAQQIWACKAAGVKTYGNSSGNAKDAAGTIHEIRYNEVEKTAPYYMKITITEYKEEELPQDYEEEVKAAVSKWALTEYTPGKDIIPKRAIQAIYLVPGIDDVVVEVSADGSTGWTTERIPVDLSHYAYFPESNISVILSTGE